MARWEKRWDPAWQKTLLEIAAPFVERAGRAVACPRGRRPLGVSGSCATMTCGVREQGDEDVDIGAAPAGDRVPAGSGGVAGEDAGGPQHRVVAGGHVVEGAVVGRAAGDGAGPVFLCLETPHSDVLRLDTARGALLGAQVRGLLLRKRGLPVLPRLDLAARRRRTMSRCQRRIVSGVTSSRSPWQRAFGITLSRVARSARSAQCRFELRGCC